jgi:UDP-glucose 4-epimerase
MNVTIFGGAGFVGLNVARALLDRGQAVTLFDHAEMAPSARHAFAPFGERMRLLRGDVTDRAAIEAAIGAGCDALVLGAAITAGASRDAAEPERIMAVNLLAQVPILQAARRAKVRRVLNLSSGSAYGASGQRFAILEETAPCDPVSLYAITKFASERVAARLSDLWQTDVVSVRLSAVFGPFEHSGGVRDTPSPQTQIVECLVRGMPALLDNPGARDWIYAPDVAEAVTFLLEAPRLRHALYNISTGATFTAEAWGAVIAKLRPGSICRLAQSGEVPTVTMHGPARAPLSIARLAEEFGWRAKFDCDSSAMHLDRWLRDRERSSR